MAPHRAEPIYDLYRLFLETYTQKAKDWAKILLNRKLDIEKDPFDLEVNCYPDYNQDLKAELEKFLDKRKFINKYSLLDAPLSVIKI